MATFALQVGLTIKKGDRCWTFVRDLGENSVQFEDIHTRAVSTFHAAGLVRDILDGKYEVLNAVPFGPALTSPSASAGPDDAIASLIGRLTTRQCKEIERRERYVRAVIRSGSKSAARLEISGVVVSVAQRFHDEKTPSVSTVIRWLRCFNRSEGNVLSLLSGNARRAKASRLNEVTREIAWEVLRQNYFIFRGKGVMASYTRYMARLSQVERRRGGSPIEPMSLSSFRRLVQSIPRYEADRVRLGATAANNKWRHAIGGIYATRPLERVEMDHTLLDLYVIDDRRGIPLGRPTLTLIIDAFSKYILSVFISFEGESLGRVCQSLKLALRPKDDLVSAVGAEREWLTPGLPETILVDNALAFHSYQFRQIAWALRCDLEFAAVRKPWFKPNVERALGTMMNTLPIEGMPEKIRGLAKRTDPKITACVMFSDLCQCLVRWAVDVYPVSIPERSLLRPYDTLFESMQTMPPPQFAGGLEQLDLLTGLSRHLTVAQHGVEMFHISYRSPELRDLAQSQPTPKFKTEIKFDPNDLGSVWVKNPSAGTWIRVPSMIPDYANGLTLSQHRLIRQFTKEKLRGEGAYIEWRRVQAEFEDMVDNAVRRGKRLIRDMRKYALLHGLSSVKPLAKDLPEANARLAKEVSLQVFTDNEIKVLPEEIPEFKGFVSDDFNLEGAV